MGRKVSSARSGGSSPGPLEEEALENMRLFVALHLEPPTLAPVRSLQGRLRAADDEAQVRWVEPEGMHLTLKFLGETAEEQLPGLRGAIAAASASRPAPRLAPAGVGGFPNLRRPRVLWVGLREEGQVLASLQAAIEAALEDLGWPRENRAFQPHLTLGRRREGPERNPGPLAPALERALAGVEPFQETARPQPRLVLFRSHLGPRGARYEALTTWNLPLDR